MDARTFNMECIHSGSAALFCTWKVTPEVMINLKDQTNGWVG